MDRIANVDFLASGIVVVFEDGTTVLFDADFLWKHRGDEGSRLLQDLDEEGSEAKVDERQSSHR